MSNNTNQNASHVFKKPAKGEREYSVTLSDANAQTQGQKVIIDDKVLMESLIKHGDQTVAALSLTIAPISLSDISLDESGRIVIDNADFAKAFHDFGGIYSVNTYCSNSTCA